MLRNIIANYIGRTYSVAAIYLFVPFYVNILGAAAYGIIASYAVLLTFAALVDVGLSATFAREVARCDDKIKLLNLLSTIERILIVTVGGFALIAYLGADLIASYWFDTGGKLDEHIVSVSFKLMATMLIPQMGMSLYTAGLFGLQKQVKANLIQSLFTTFKSGLVVLPILWKPDLPLFFGWQLGTTIIFALISRIILVKELGFPGLTPGTFAYTALKSKLVFAGGMMWVSVISSINSQLDKLVVSKIFPLTDLGHYTLASTIAQIPLALVGPIAVAFYPLVTTNVAKQDVDEVWFVFRTYGQWIAFTGALGAFGVSLFAPDLLSLWLQDPNIPSVVANIARVLAIGTLFMCLGVPSYYLALAYGQSGFVAILNSGTLLFSIPLMIAAVQVYGLLGASLPWIVLNFINLVLILRFSTRTHLVRYRFSQIIYTLIYPVGLALIPLLASQYIAGSLKLSPLWACSIAAAGAVCALLAFLCLRNAGLVSNRSSKSEII